ncbi:MAG: hypothetical protein AAFP81_12640 [Pseudomonadota bacterium]
MNRVVLSVGAAALLVIGFERGISVAISFAASLTVVYSFGSIFVSRGNDIVIRVISIVISASVLLYLNQVSVLAISMICGAVLFAILRIASLFRRE